MCVTKRVNRRSGFIPLCSGGLEWYSTSRSNPRYTRGRRVREGWAAKIYKFNARTQAGVTRHLSTALQAWGSGADSERTETPIRQRSHVERISALTRTSYQVCPIIDQTFKSYHGGSRLHRFARNRQGMEGSRCPCHRSGDKVSNLVQAMKLYRSLRIQCIHPSSSSRTDMRLRSRMIAVTFLFTRQPPFAPRWM